MATIEEIRAAGCQITGDDIRLIAKGHWNKYFYHRIYPGLRTSMALATLFTLIFMGLMMFIASQESPGVAVPSGYPIAALISLGLAALSLIRIFMRFNRDLEDYADHCVELWNLGKLVVPNRDSVIDFTRTHTRRWYQWDW